ncbi:MAG: hypothetical protein LAQ69_25560 [Acidobacteriia bacterium]|nr:hypothetical protein [Terriglobia bacterium]
MGPHNINACVYYGLPPLPQQTFRSGTAAPNLYVGDQRPHKAIFREGHLYDARVVGTFLSPFVPSGLIPTVSYEVTRKLGAGFFPTNVYDQMWANTYAYAPMFDVPANVVTSSVGPPFINLEKLFVATTGPPLPGVPDTSYDTAPGGIPAALAADFGAGDPRSRETFGLSGLPPGQLPAMANCFTNNPLSWASLFDTRCGQDVTDTNQTFRNPFTGQIAIITAHTIRGDESTDPNDGSLWNFGAYAQRRDAAFTALSHWGTFGANYKLSFPTTDAFGNPTITLGGVATDAAGNPRAEFPYIQMAVNLGFTPSITTGTQTTSAGVVTPGSATITGLSAAFIAAAAAGQPVTGEGVPAGATITAVGVNSITISAPANALAPAAATPVTGFGGNSVVPAAVGIPFKGVNSALYGPAGVVPIPAGMTPPGNAPPSGTFGADDAITRREMAYWIVKSQMDEAAIILYLQNSQTVDGVSGLAGVTFADVPRNDPGWPYIEVMARRGYTAGCAAGLARQYCPDYVAKIRDLAVFMIRAKMGNLFGSVLSGCGFNATGTESPTASIFPPALTTNCQAGGDNFGLFVTGLPYFTDNPSPATAAGVGNDGYVFLQKLRELRIDNGTFLGPNNDARNGTYSPGTAAPVVAPNDPGAVLRKQVAVYMMRGFFF